MSSIDFCVALALAGADPEALSVHTDFPGGAAEKTAVDQQQRRVRFAPSSKAGWATWWCFEVRGVTPGERITIEQTGGQAPSGKPVFSLDGRTWRYVDKSTGKVHEQTISADRARFAWYVPYTLDTVKPLVEQASKAGPHVENFELCRSEGDLPVHAFRFRDAQAKSDDLPAIWIHARQHAWEAGGSWTAHGLIQWLLSDDADARELTRLAEVVVVPIMDVDNAERGLGGKDQKPHDHNRDWTDSPHWASVHEAQKRITALEEAKRLTVFLDLHDPGWAGKEVEYWCYGYNKFPEVRRAVSDRFLAAAREEMKGPLTFKGRVQDRPEYAGKPTSGQWVLDHTRESVVAGCFEVPIELSSYDDPPPAAHLRLGGQLGRALLRYVRIR